MQIPPAEAVMGLFSALEGAGVRYALLRDMKEALPDSYDGGSDVDIIICPDDWQRARSLLKSEKWFEIIHPHDNGRNFVFLYGMRPFRFFVRGKAALDICFQLACRSTNDGEWVPLDQEIQMSVWSSRRWDNLRQCYVLSALDECVHLLARAFFDKSSLPGEYKSRIERLYCQVSAGALEERLELVFFKAAPEIMTVLRDGKLEQLVPRVSAFSEY